MKYWRNWWHTLFNCKKQNCKIAKFAKNCKIVKAIPNEAKASKNLWISANIHRKCKSGPISHFFGPKWSSVSLPILYQPRFIKKSQSRQTEQLINFSFIHSSCERLLLGTLKSNKIVGTNTSQTLSNTKRGTDLGTLVIPFDLNIIPVTYSVGETAILVCNRRGSCGGPNLERICITSFANYPVPGSCLKRLNRYNFSSWQLGWLSSFPTFFVCIPEKIEKLDTFEPYM